MCLSGIWGIHLPTFTSTNSNGTKFVPVVSESRRCLLPKVNIYLTKQFVRCSVYCVCVSGYGWCPEAGVVLYAPYMTPFPNRTLERPGSILRTAKQNYDKITSHTSDFWCRKTKVNFKTSQRKLLAPSFLAPSILWNLVYSICARNYEQQTYRTSRQSVVMQIEVVTNTEPVCYIRRPEI